MKIRTIIFWIFQMCIHFFFFPSELAGKNYITPFGFKHFLIITHFTDWPNLFCFHSFKKYLRFLSFLLASTFFYCPCPPLATVCNSGAVIRWRIFNLHYPKKLTFSWFLFLWHLIVIDTLLFLTCSYPKLLLLSARCEDDRQGRWLNISHLKASVTDK